MLTGKPKPKGMAIPWEGIFNMKAIYKWTNLLNQKVYIGKSVDVAKRLREYRYEIKRGHTRPIISAMRKYGLDNFNFEILENCDDLTHEQILEREQYWMDYYDALNEEKGYNILKAEETPSEKWSMGSNNTKARLTEEDVLNIRLMIYSQNISPATAYSLYANRISFDAFTKAYRGDTWKHVDTSMIRNINSEVQRKGVKKAKLTKEQVIEIRRQYEVENKSISEIYTQFLGFCTRETIKRVINYETWKNI